MVYARSVAGHELTFIVSGKLWRNSLVMQDLQTETLWSQITGEALQGPLTGERLTVLPAVQTSYREWVAAHPETRVLRKSEALLASRYESYFADPDRIGIFRAHYLMDRMPGKAQILGVTAGPHALAVSDSLLLALGLVNAELDGQALSLHRSPDGGVRAWRAALNWDAKRKLLVDAAGAWDPITGESATGKGAALEELQVQRAFWFAWSGFYPNTRVID